MRCLSRPCVSCNPTPCRIRIVQNFNRSRHCLHVRVASRVGNASKWSAHMRHCRCTVGMCIYPSVLTHWHMLSCFECKWLRGSLLQTVFHSVDICIRHRHTKRLQAVSSSNRLVQTPETWLTVTTAMLHAAAQSTQPDGRACDVHA